jgi:hypothetical protein
VGELEHDDGRQRLGVGDRQIAEHGARSGGPRDRHRQDHHGHVEVTEVQVRVQHRPVVDEGRHRAVDDRRLVPLPHGGLSAGDGGQEGAQERRLFARVQLVLAVLRAGREHRRELVQRTRRHGPVRRRDRWPGEHAHVGGLEDAHGVLDVGTRPVPPLARLEVPHERRGPVHRVP